jgi:hypothetical protein
MCMRACSCDCAGARVVCVGGLVHVCARWGFVRVRACSCVCVRVRANSCVFGRMRAFSCVRVRVRACACVLVRADGKV